MTDGIVASDLKQVLLFSINQVFLFSINNNHFCSIGRKLPICQSSNKCVDKKNIRLLRSHDGQKDG